MRFVASPLAGFGLNQVNSTTPSVVYAVVGAFNPWFRVTNLMLRVKAELRDLWTAGGGLLSRQNRRRFDEVDIPSTKLSPELDNYGGAKSIRSSFIWNRPLVTYFAGICVTGTYGYLGEPRRLAKGLLLGYFERRAVEGLPAIWYVRTPAILLLRSDSMRTPRLPLHDARQVARAQDNTTSQETDHRMRPPPFVPVCSWLELWQQTSQLLLAAPFSPSAK
jgi:hypothetical protein